MADYNDIKQAIATNLPDNNKKEITAAKLRSTLNEFVDKVETTETGLEQKCEVLNNIDDKPTMGSNNLVKSGGVHQSIKPFPINLVDAEQFWLKDTGISTSTNLLPVSGWLTLLIPCYPNQIFQWVKNEDQASYALCDSNKHQLPLFDGSTYRILPLGKNTITIPDNPDIKYIAFDLGRSQNTPIPNQTIYLNSDATIFEKISDDIEEIKNNNSTSYNIDTFVRKSINVFPQLKIYNRLINVGERIINNSTSKLVYVPVEYGDTIIWRRNTNQYPWYAFCTDDLLHWIAGTDGHAHVGDNEITVTEQSAKYIALQISFNSSPDDGTYIIYKSWKDSINEVIQVPIPLNPWKGKKMLVCGASNISVGNWAVHAGEMLGMTVINAGSSPRNYNTEKGTVHRWHNDSVGYCYSLTNSPTEQTVFHQTKGSKSNPFTFVSFDSSAQKLTLIYQGQNYVFDYIDYTENDVWLCGLSSTIAECQAGGVSTSMSWESKFTSDLNLVVFGEQAGETQVTSNDIIDSILLPTSDNLHYRYSDNVPLEDRRNTTIGAIIYLLDKLWSSVENGGKDAKLCRVVFTLDALYDTDYSSLNDEREAIKRMGDRLNLPYLEHYKKLYLSLYNRTDNYDGDGWCYDGIHPSEKGAERLKYMFANELLQLY